MSRLLLCFLALGLIGSPPVAQASPEDFASPLRFAVEFDYTSAKFDRLFVGTALAQGITGFLAEWIPLTRYGKFGLGIGYHYAFSRTVVFSDATTSRLNAHFVQLGASYRLDYLPNQYVVPYARFALAVIVPRLINNFGTSETRTNLPTQKATEVAFGGELLLDWIEPKSAGNLDREIGINNLYIFGEYVSVSSPAGATADLSYSALRGGVRCEF